MIRCLGTNVLLFPAPLIAQSPGGIHYPDNLRIGDQTDQQRFWVAAMGPKVVDLAIKDHVICPMAAEEHERLEGGARIVPASQIIAKLTEEPYE
jgi:hypothetical protein